MWVSFFNAPMSAPLTALADRDRIRAGKTKSVLADAAFLFFNR